MSKSLIRKDGTLRKVVANVNIVDDDWVENVRVQGWDVKLEDERGYLFSVRGAGVAVEIVVPLSVLDQITAIVVARSAALDNADSTV